LTTYKNTPVSIRVGGKGVDPYRVGGDILIKGGEVSEGIVNIKIKLLATLKMIKIK